MVFVICLFVALNDIVLFYLVTTECNVYEVTLNTTQFIALISATHFGHRTTIIQK